MSANKSVHSVTNDKITGEIDLNVKSMSYGALLSFW